MALLKAGLKRLSAAFPIVQCVEVNTYTSTVEALSITRSVLLALEINEVYCIVLPFPNALVVRCSLLDLMMIFEKEAPTGRTLFVMTTDMMGSLLVDFPNEEGMDFCICSRGSCEAAIGRIEKMAPDTKRYDCAEESD